MLFCFVCLLVCLLCFDFHIYSCLFIIFRNIIDYYFEGRCGNTISIGTGAGVVYSGTSASSQLYAENLAGCTVTFTASAGRKILITWEYFDVEDSPISSACADTLTIYDGSTDFGTVLNTDKKCGDYVSSSITSRYQNSESTGNSITVKLVTDGNNNINRFQFIVTSFSTAGKHLRRLWLRVHNCQK